jgi:hypothetical protein
MPLPFKLIFRLSLLSGMLSACSDPTTSTEQAIIKPLESQTQALEQAKQLEKSMQTAAETQRKEIEAQLQ